MADNDRKKPPKSKPPKLKVNGGPKKGELPPIPATPVDEGIDENAPPKIKLGSANGHGETTKIELPPDAMDKVTAAGLSEAAKSETSRIDLSKARPPSSAKSDTARLDLTVARPRQVENSGISEGVDEGELAEASKKSTIRIDTPIDDASVLQDNADPAGIDLDATAKVDLNELNLAPPTDSTRSEREISEEGLSEISKSSTIHIDSPIADAPKLEDDADPAVGAKDATAKVDINLDDQAPVDEEADRRKLEEISKSSTIQIGAPVDEEPVDDDSREAAKSSTARVDVEEEPQKGDTARLDTDKLLQHEASEASKKRTARIDMSEVLDADEKDIFKRRTALMDSSRLPEGDVVGPKTIRVRKSDTPPTTPLKKSPVAAGGGDRKSETSRIDVPEEAMAASGPPTKPKTIRIKRSDGSTASKQLSISRPPSGAVPVTSRITAADAEAPQGPGVAFTILTLAAVVVAAVTLYILAAQTLGPDLPWPGRLG